MKITLTLCCLLYFTANAQTPLRLKLTEIARIFGFADKDIFLCEGAFDSFFLDNSIVMLGKKMSKLLFETLYAKANKNIIICCDGDAFEDGIRVYAELNGGRLYNKIKIVKLPLDKDVCDLRGQIDEYYYEMR